MLRSGPVVLEPSRCGIVPPGVTGSPQPHDEKLMNRAPAPNRAGRPLRGPPSRRSPSCRRSARDGETDQRWRPGPAPRRTLRGGRGPRDRAPTPDRLAKRWLRAYPPVPRRPHPRAFVAAGRLPAVASRTGGKPDPGSPKARQSAVLRSLRDFGGTCGQPTILHPDDPVCPPGDVRVVSDHDHRAPLA